MTRVRLLRLAATAVALSAVLSAGALEGVAQGEHRKQLTITASEHGYDPARIEVRQDEIVAITLVAKDGPHTFNIDAYRIAKRAQPGAPVQFEFRAERAGRFSFYCNLTAPNGQPHQMRGELVVRK